MLMISRRAFALLSATALLASGCVTASVERRTLDDVLASIQALPPSEQSSGSASGTVPNPSASDGPASPVASPTRAPSSTAPRPAASDDAPTPEPSESIPEPPPQSDFPMEASLDKDCVLPGGQMRITVQVGANTGVGYHAIYAGGEGGAEPPYGNGHGGNAGDLTDEEGRYTDTWVVSPTAPIGPARVDVVAGRNGGFATAVLRFEVADPAGPGCP